jgi:hypothetical protein
LFENSMVSTEFDDFKGFKRIDSTDLQHVMWLPWSFW